MTARRIRLAHRAAWKCMWCSQPMRAELGFENTCTVEHVIPRCEGGVNLISNLGSACARCNRLRGCEPAEQFALRAANFPPDSRITREALNAERRIIRKKVLSGELPPATVSPSKQREREDRKLARRAYATNSDVNPFEPESRCWRMFNRLVESRGDYVTRQLIVIDREPTPPVSIWTRMLRTVLSWFKSVT
jgi:hypothetical protein